MNPARFVVLSHSKAGIFVGENMKTIPLTQGQEAIVDDHWYDYLMQWKWQAQYEKSAQNYYAVRSEGRGESKKWIGMHRVVAQTPDGMLCDHIRHNTLLNTEENLRNVTHAQNMINRRMHNNNTTGVVGVSVNANGNYKAQLKFQGKNVLNKTFKTIEEASAARKEAEEKYFREFRYKD